MSKQNGPKNLDEINEQEWCLYHWQDVTNASDERRMFMRGAERTPDAAAEAKEQWATWVYLKRVHYLLEMRG